MTESRWIRIMGIESVSRALGISADAVHKRVRRDPTFPKPRTIRSGGNGRNKRAVWIARDVERWIQANKK